MQIKNGIITKDDVETEIYKLSEQGIQSIIMVIQKVFMDIAQDRENVSIEDLLENYDFVLDSNKKIWVTNPVSIVVDKKNMEDSDDDDDEDEETN